SLTRPSSIRLILDPEDRISHPARSREMLRASRNLRSCWPSSMRSTVGPLADPSPEPLTDPGPGCVAVTRRPPSQPVSLLTGQDATSDEVTPSGTWLSGPT